MKKMDKQLLQEADKTEFNVMDAVGKMYMAEQLIRRLAAALRESRAEYDELLAGVVAELLAAARRDERVALRAALQPFVFNPEADGALAEGSGEYPHPDDVPLLVGCDLGTVRRGRAVLARVEP